MPWKKTSPEEQQVRFIKEWQKGEVAFVRLCEQFGISTKTGYKRRHRFEESGWEGLADWSRAPHHHPNQISQHVMERLVEAKRAHPTWGPRKLIPWLRERDPETVWPAPSTGSGVFQRLGLSTRRRRARWSTPWSEPFADARHPNDVWCIDFKGWFRTGDGQRCDPLTVADAATRYLVLCQAVDHPRGDAVHRALQRAFQEYGLPWTIRTDNGPPFASRALGSLSPLAVWWIKLGIVPERTAPGHPEQNGRLERFHRTLKAETASPPRATPRAQQRAFDTFRQQYNHERPHEALGQKSPASCYTPSFRSYPTKLSDLEYEGDVTVRRVRTDGTIRWQGRLLYISEALCGERVGLEEQDDRHWTIQFGPLDIGTLDGHLCTIQHTPVKVLPMCLG